MEMVGIKSWFPYTVPLFCYGTRNGDHCENYNETEFPMHYIDATLWVEGYDHGVSWTKEIDLDAISLIDVVIFDMVDLGGYLHG